MPIGKIVDDSVVYAWASALINTPNLAYSDTCRLLSEWMAEMGNVAVVLQRSGIASSAGKARLSVCRVTADASILSHSCMVFCACQWRTSPHGRLFM